MRIDSLSSLSSRHEMSLPRSILIGNGAIRELGSFLKNLGYREDVLIVTGPHIAAKVRSEVEETLSSNGFRARWSVIGEANMETVEAVRASISSRMKIVVGLGGGKTVDVAKLAAYKAGIPFISVPTSASHDGIASPFASIKGSDRPYSYMARAPLGILADIDIIISAPFRLLSSGCGDLIGKITAVRDWEIARDDVGEYFGKYAASLANLSAKIVIDESENIGRRSKDGFRDVVEALISAGVAAGIAGSSRPCSGSEHLFAHALDMISANKALHGEKVGLGTILMANLHRLDWTFISKSLRNVGAPVRGGDVGIGDEEIVKAIVYAREVRPDRYTILNKMKLGEEEARRLAIETEVI